MTNLITLVTDYRVDVVTRALARISAEENYKRSIISLPGANKENILLILPDDQPDTRRVIMRTAIDLTATIVDDGSSSFLTDDNDVMFIEQLPSPEDEVRQIVLRAEISEIREIKKCAESVYSLSVGEGFKFSQVDGGYSIMLNSIVILDIFYENGDSTMTIEFDATYAGAGYFEDARRFIFKLAMVLGGNLTFFSDDDNTYCEDLDFEKLRKLYYKMIRQQLAFAFADDRDGLQAYIGWSGDSYEPALIPGSVVSCFGRFELEKIKSEITKWGFEAVADHHFLFRNHPVKDGLDMLKESLLHLWCDISEHRIKSRRIAVSADIFKNESFDIAEQTVAQLTELLYDNSAIPFPYGSYASLLKFLHHSIGDKPPIHPSYVTHYPIGFLNSDVSYGFGSYLRHVVLPGGCYPSEFSDGDSLTLVLADENTGEQHADIIVSIDYEESEEVMKNHLFFIPSTAEWFECDIGGTATCRYCTYTENIGSLMTFYCVSAIIEIRDERYFFKTLARDPNFSEYFIEVIRNSRAFEEIDDIIMPNPNEKPRAWGATFYKPIDMSFVHNKENLSELDAMLDDLHLDHIVKIDIKSEQTTDISSKIGGQPYFPPNCSTDIIRGEYEFVLQINFSEANRDGWMEDMPAKGLLQLWIKDFPEILNADRAMMCKNDRVRVIWYSEPNGGYVTEEHGSRLCFKHDLTMPGGRTKKHRELREFAKANFPDWNFDMAEIARRNISIQPRIGGRIEYFELPYDILSKIGNENFTIFKLKMPGKNENSCMELLINRDDLRKRNFDAAAAAFYDSESFATEIFFEDDEKYDYPDPPPIDIRSELVRILDGEFVKRLLKLCETCGKPQDVDWIFSKPDDEILYHLTHDKRGKYVKLLSNLGLSKEILSNILGNYDELASKYGAPKNTSKADKPKSFEYSDDIGQNDKI